MRASPARDVLLRPKPSLIANIVLGQVVCLVAKVNTVRVASVTVILACLVLPLAEARLRRRVAVQRHISSYGRPEFSVPRRRRL